MLHGEFEEVLLRVQCSLSRTGSDLDFDSSFVFGGLSFGGLVGTICLLLKKLILKSLMF